MTNRELIDRTKKGEKAAFGELYRRNHAQIVHFVFKRTGNREIAQDIASQAFLAGFKRLANLREYEQERAFGSWMTTISKNLIVDYYKSGRNQNETLVDEFFDTAVDAIRPDEEVEREDFVQRLSDTLASALSKLTDLQRTAVQLRFGEGLTFKEVGERMNKPESSVRVLTHRALARLKKRGGLHQLFAEYEQGA